MWCIALVVTSLDDATRPVWPFTSCFCVWLNRCDIRKMLLTSGLWPSFLFVCSFSRILFCHFLILLPAPIPVLYYGFSLCTFVSSLPDTKGSTANHSSCTGLYKNSSVRDKRATENNPSIRVSYFTAFHFSGVTESAWYGILNTEMWRLFFPRHVCSVNVVLLDLQGCYSSSEEKRPTVDLHCTSERNCF